MSTPPWGLADPDCDMTHLFGLAALDCLPDTMEGLRAERPDLMPVEACDNCRPEDLDPGWWDIDAARAVAARLGTSVEVIERHPFVVRGS